MLVFDYVIRLYNQDVSAEAAPAAAALAIESTKDWRGLAVESATEWRGSAAAGSSYSWRGRTSWNTVRNYLSSMTANVTDDVADGRNECWWGQWWSRTLAHDNEYKIVQGLWSSCPAKGVVNPAGIQW
jgi:hypothetical protein